MVAPKGQWNKKDYLTMRMTEKRDDHDESKRFFTSGFEAFIVTLMENNLARWSHRAKWYKKKNDWNAKLPKKTLKVKGKDRPVNPCHDAKFSIDDAGQAAFETWSDDGLEFFSITNKAIANERKNNGQAYIKFEGQFLEYLQDKHKKSAEKKGTKRTISEVDPGDGSSKAQKRANFVVEDADEGDLDSFEIDLNEDNLSVPADQVAQQGGNKPVDGDNDSQPSQQSQQIADPELAEGETEE